MKAIIEKIEHDPEKRGLEKARSVCKRWLKMHNNPYIKEWDKILKGEWSDIKKVLLDDSEKGAALRQCNPFCGILSPKERWAIYRRFREK